MISGLRLGADDYWTKDISQDHMLARIAALFRRMKALRAPEQQEDILKQERTHSERGTHVCHLA